MLLKHDATATDECVPDPHAAKSGPVRGLNQTTPVPRSAKPMNNRADRVPLSVC